MRKINGKNQKKKHHTEFKSKYAKRCYQMIALYAFAIIGIEIYVFKLLDIDKMPIPNEHLFKLEREQHNSAPTIIYASLDLRPKL